MKSVVVAIVQSFPVYLNLKASIERAADLTREAAQRGARLIVFGETWLPGYPAWLDFCPDAALWDNQPTKEVFARLRQNSIVIAGEEMKILEQLCKELKITLVMGVNERVEQGPGNGTLYNSLLFFDSTGGLINHHRKLVPTYTERLVWGPGDAAGLRAVDSSVGRIGGLICWEHWMPLSRQVLHDSGEQIHIAAWPGVKDAHQLASRHYAFEGRCFVVAAGSLMKAGDLPPEMRPAEEMAPDHLLINGGSAIYAPDGSCVAGPIFDTDTILTAELDLTRIDREQMTLDVSGHYSRPDIFGLKVRRKRIRN